MPALRTILKAALAHADQRVAVLNSTFAGDDTAGTYLAVVKQWHADIHQTCQAVLAEADSNCDDRRYIETWSSHFPTSPILTHFGGGAYAGEVNRDPGTSFVMTMPHREDWCWASSKNG